MEKLLEMGRPFQGPFKKAPEDGVLGQGNTKVETSSTSQSPPLSELERTSRDGLRKLIATELRNFLRERP